MSKSLLGLGLLFASAVPNRAQRQTVLNSDRSISVRVCNKTSIAPAALARAEALASRILGEAGLQITWLSDNNDVPVRQQSAPKDQLGPTDFVLNLLDQLQGLGPQLKDSTLGLAVIPDGGTPGYLAYLSYSRASRVAKESSVPVDLVVGLGAAHEIGHLLLGENAHSPSGLMKILWSPQDLRAGSRGNLLFTRKQSKRLRLNLQLRQATLVVRNRLDEGREHQ